MIELIRTVADDDRPVVRVRRILEVELPTRAAEAVEAATAPDQDEDAQWSAWLAAAAAG